MEVIEAIKGRYSCRSFTSEPIDDDVVEELLECARWAPSGLNNQPWRFVVVRDEQTRSALAQLTTSYDVISQAPVNVVVLLDREAVYHHDKDVMGIGACIQNLLLAAHSLGLGTCWLGQILNRATDVLQLLGLDPELYELMAVVSIGHPSVEPPSDRRRKPLSELCLPPPGAPDSRP
ncbi:MAG: nitroreductase [Promethearchaeota archaeon]